MRRFLVAFIGALLCAPAFAVTLTWTAPDHNVDGSVLTDLTGYQIFQWLMGGTPTLLQTVGLVNIATINGLPAGTNCFLLRSVSAAGGPSTATGAVCTTVAAPVPPKPNPPTNLQAKPTP